jgi:hypothetical protein
MFARTLAVTALMSAAVALAQGPATVLIDSFAHGCGSQGSALPNGQTASASVRFDYDPATATLEVTVKNMLAGGVTATTPVIDEIFFSAPYETISSATLISQSAAGAVQPNFRLDFDEDSESAPVLVTSSCFGEFNFCLMAQSNGHGVASATTTNTCELGAGPFLVEPTFRIHLQGPGVAGLDSASFAAAASRSYAHRRVNVAATFTDGNCSNRATVANGHECNQSVFLRGTPRIGDAVMLCVSGNNQCRAFIGVSATPGPELFKDYILPIGTPILFTLDLGYFPVNEHEFQLPLQIPMDWGIIGLDLYWTSLTHPYQTFTNFRFAPAYQMTITGL